MKKHFSFRLAVAQTALIFTVLTSFLAFADTTTYNKEETLTPNMALGPGYAGNAGLTAEQIRAAEQQIAAAESAAVTLPGIETGEPDEYLGVFRVSGYCNCEKCSGGHTLTYSGTVPTACHTIAADLEHYPIGTKLLIDGIVYTVEDKGSSVTDNWLDIFFATHEEALAFGLKNMDVYTVKVIETAAEPTSQETLAQESAAQ